MLPINLNISSDFFKEEIRDGYKVSPEQKKVWAVELDLLYLLENICEKYNIKFWADGGTMLGAVRHNGFIPWDDDIDIIMTRENYQKFCDVAENEIIYPYFFQTEYTDPGSLRGHAQLRNSRTTGILYSELPFKYSFNQGIFIDIFPLDYLPDDENEKRNYIQKVEGLMKQARRQALKTYSYMPAQRNFVKKLANRTVLKCSHSIYGSANEPNRYFKEFEQFITKNNSEPTHVVGKLFYCPVKEKSIWKTQWLESATYLPFEMLELPVASGYEQIMDKFFGNWRTPMKSNSAHGSVLFDTEKSYIDVLGGVN